MRGQAIECDGMEPMALAIHGHVASYLHKDFELAFQRFRQGARINPNAAPAWLWSAAAHAWMGDGPVAIERNHRAMALSPYDPLMYAYSGIAGMAYLVDGQYERAIECALRSLRENRTYTPRVSAAGHRTDAGRPGGGSPGAVAALLELEPGLTVERFRGDTPAAPARMPNSFAMLSRGLGIPLSGASATETARE